MSSRRHSLSSRRNSASSLLAPQKSHHDTQNSVLEQDQQSSDDGYDYNRVDEAPEAEATVKALGQIYPDQQNDLPNISTTLKEGDSSAAFEETRPDIYQRRFAGRYAQVPDEEKANLNGAAADRQESQPRHETDLSTASRDSAKARHIALSWSSARRDVLQLNLAAPQTKSRDEVLPKRVLWQHTEQRLLGIKNLEDEIIKCQSRGLSESEVGLTKRLLERVRNTAEKSFVGGKFLVSKALRYDNQDVSRYTVDKTCIFFSFPYFCVANTLYGAYPAKGEPEHPPRTLLQSRYRLHQTIDRDDKQSIRMLSGKEVTSSIAIHAGDHVAIPDQGTQHLVYVSQLWGVVIGLDTMVTCGPVNEHALQSSSVFTSKSKPASTKNALALVRIQFDFQDEREDLIYPINQCSSWIGLLNKKQQITEFLGDKRGKANPKDYRFWLDNTRIDINNWTNLIEESQSTEMLSLWMKSETPEIKVSLDGDASKSVSTNITAPKLPKTGTLKGLNMNAIITPILAWPILDSFGDIDTQPIVMRIDRFLTRIYLFLFMGDGIHKQQRAMRPTIADAQQSARDEKLPATVKTLSELKDYSNAEKRSPVAKEIFQRMHSLFEMFIPAEHDQNWTSIQLFWGAVHEICEAAEKQILKSGLTQFMRSLDSIAYHTLRLHQGVYCKENRQSCCDDISSRKEALAEGTILLATMVDAFGAILHMLVETLRFLRLGGKTADADLMGPDSKVKEYSNSAVKYLRGGWDQLVRELHGRDKNNTIGPIVTPEAITIKLMERLVSGVFQASKIDIIHIYEQCLDHLSLKVESEASRRLLQKINIFQDEVAVVNRVLKEQYDVICSLRRSLDPTTFRSPSIARKLRYHFECKAISKVLVTIKVQLENGRELEERAKQLAIQNVQLVETLQDDQSRAVFVFTIVTVIFLPLSFIAGFFGMNFDSITQSTNGVVHFWEIAVPVTVVIFILCAIFAVKGELVFIWFSRCSRWIMRKWNGIKEKQL